MKIVAAGLEADIHHCAGLPAVFGALVFLSVEFLDGVERQMAGRGSRDTRVVDHAFAVVDVIVVGAIDRVVIVFETVSVGGNAVKTAARRALDSGTKLKQFWKSLPCKGSSIDQLVAHSAAQRVGDGVDRQAVHPTLRPLPKSARA